MPSEKREQSADRAARGSKHPARRPVASARDAMQKRSATSATTTTTISSSPFSNKKNKKSALSKRAARRKPPVICSRTGIRLIGAGVRSPVPVTADLISRSQKQREAVQRFRRREKERLRNTQETIVRMRREIAILNATLDQVDTDVELLNELIAIHKGHQLQRKLAAKAITASQQSSSSQQQQQQGQQGQQGSPAASQAPPPVQHLTHPAEERTCDLSQLLSSPSDLEQMARMVRFDAYGSPRSG